MTPKRLPPDVAAYRQTSEFTESTIPTGLLRSHRTKHGVWARIHIVEGSLVYRILEPQLSEQLLCPEIPGVVEPGVLHQVEPRGPVRFFVEFLRG